jgi:hypothetical protein
MVSGPSWTANPWVGSADTSGLSTGSSRWVSFDWVVPVDRTAGTHQYTAHVHVNGLGAISATGPTQAFAVGGGPSARIDALFGVTGATPGGSATLWGRVTNTSGVALPAGSKAWFYVDGPAWTGDHWVGFASIDGLAPGATQWYSLSYSIPASAQAGTYTYRVQAWRPGAPISPWSVLQPFTVSP